MKVKANGIDIEVEDSGGTDKPVVLLIMGLGMQLIAWPPALVRALTDAGYRVIRHDNRDIGLSQHFDYLGAPNILWALLRTRLGLAVHAPYGLKDMAADALGVLDALGVARAHVVGVSMGGMIAQRVALAAPQRVITLTSIMSSSGARKLPQASGKVRSVLFGRPASSAPGDIVNHYVRLYQTIGSPGFPMAESEMRQRIEFAIKRSFHPMGTLRQMMAIAADTDIRAAELPYIRKPTLVLHGRADPLVPYACGEDTARRIPGAKMVGIDGMGHDLAPGVIERLLPHLQPSWRSMPLPEAHDALPGPEQSPLGRASTYPDRYDATLLFPIARADKRHEIGASGQPPFVGADLWTAFELSWLNPRGKPQVAIAHVTVPCETANIVESKSFKLYLGGFSNTAFADAAAVRERMRADLNEALWRGAPALLAGVGVKLLLPDAFDREPVHELDGLSLDRLDIECTRYTPAPELLRANFDEQPVSEVLTSNLLKSNCLVTGQPDWGAVQIAYSGPQIEQEGLLQYIVSFRNHDEFHEQCVERIFMDIWRRCKPAKLAVYARYTRRGGLDINPFRTSHPQALPRNVRMARQ